MRVKVITFVNFLRKSRYEVLWECYRREEAAAENAEPVQLYWKADKQAIHQIDDDGNLTKSFGFGK